MTKKINNKIQTQFSIFFVKVSYSISYYIQSKFINFSKFLLSKYLFAEHEFCGYFFTSFGSKDDQL